MSVFLEFEDEEQEWPFDFSPREVAEAVSGSVLEQEGVSVPCEVNLLITDGEGIRSLNREFRSLDRETDVLSFPALAFETPGELPELSDPALRDPETGNLMLGDIAICLERIRSQAKAYGHSEKREFAFLIAHSMLHLLGYDHESEEDAKVMEQKQESALHKLGITRD